MSVAKSSGPQILDPPLRPPQATVDQEGVVVVIFAAILVTSPTRVLASVSPIPNTYLRFARRISTGCLFPRCFERSSPAGCPNPPGSLGAPHCGRPDPKEPARQKILPRSAPKSSSSGRTSATLAAASS
jgi:hypothetical protein